MSIERIGSGPADHAQAPGVGDAGPSAPSEATRLQVLATEHWSLLATRTLSWNESFSRAGMFLSVLSGAVIALALVAQASDFGGVFVDFAIPLLSVVLFVGIATFVRLDAVNNEDIRWVAGMNRIRHAYLELHPDLQRYFVTGATDDMRGVALSVGSVIPAPTSVRLSLQSIGHEFATVPGMLGVIVAVVAGALAAEVAVAVGAATGPALAAAFIAFIVMVVVLGRHVYGSFAGLLARWVPEFPTVDSGVPTTR
ncbi:MAG: hypothetical protein E6I94_09555 [Chloroflexi bacterium]|nr:MAG: hypothetical protein E6I94_09555 [Chloroflexota bacterium]